MELRAIPNVAAERTSRAGRRQRHDETSPAAGTVRRRRGTSRVSAKNQITLPVRAMKDAGVKSGDQVNVRVAGPGKLVVERVPADPLARHAGALAGVYGPDYLEKLRDEWR